MPDVCVSSSPAPSDHYFPTPEKYGTSCECGSKQVLYEQLKEIASDNPDPENERVDMVNHPPHYNMHPLGIECIDIIEDCKDFNLGCVLKYIWRVVFGKKNNELQDLEKAQWYLERAINNRRKTPKRRIGPPKLP